MFFLLYFWLLTFVVVWSCSSSDFIPSNTAVVVLHLLVNHGMDFSFPRYFRSKPSRVSGTVSWPTGAFRTTLVASWPCNDLLGATWIHLKPGKSGLLAPLTKVIQSYSMWWRIHMLRMQKVFPTRFWMAVLPLAPYCFAMPLHDSICSRRSACASFSESRWDSGSNHPDPSTWDELTISTGNAASCTFFCTSPADHGRSWHWMVPITINHYRY